MKGFLQATLLAVLIAGCSSAENLKENAAKFSVKPTSAKESAFPEKSCNFINESKGGVRRIETGFTVAAVDWNGDGEGDGLTVSLLPLSADSRTVKAKGDIIFRLYRQDFSQLDKKGKMLLEWRIPAARTAQFWRDGIFGAYYFVLEFAGKVPDAEFGVLESCLRTEDGALFFARDTSVKLRLE